MTRSFLRTVSFLTIAFVVVVGTIFLYEALVERDTDVSRSENLPQARIRVASTTVAVDVARTPATRQKGLSGRTHLSEGRGMYFIFTSPARYAFWMKDMHFAIDIIWIDEHQRIVDYVSNVTPESYPDVFRPDAPGQYVLEVNAGFVDAHDISVGDSVSVKMR